MNPEIPKMRTPFKIFIVLLVSLFLVETTIMGVLDLLKIESHWLIALIDASLVVFFMFPILIHCQIKPLMAHIRQRMKSEIILKKSELKYRNIFENVQDVYFEVTLDGIIKELSPSIKVISRGQYQRDELLETSVYNLYADPSDREKLMKLLMANKEVGDYEIRLKNKDGSVFFCSISARVVSNNKNLPYIIIGSLRDITHRKSAEEEMKKMNDELRALNTERDRLYSVVAHDLRSPFNAFIGLSEVMVKKSGLHALSEDEMLKYSEFIHKSATNLYNLLDDLLLWSNSRQGTIPVAPVRMNLHSQVHKQIEYLNTVATSKSIAIHNYISNDIEINADSNILQTVLRNLLTNALKYTPEGGAINISSDKLPDDKVQIVITDNGIGMDQELLSRLMSGERTTRPGTNGEPSSGLGLLLCKVLLEQHKGSISASSEIGKGSKFVLTL